VATALSSTPPARRQIRSGSASGAATTASVASTATPMTTTLLTVPSPGRWRSGIQASSTSAPTRIDTTPMVQPSRSARPWCSTSQGMLPSVDRMISAMEAP
jgi:hypothetical protein